MKSLKQVLAEDKRYKGHYHSVFYLNKSDGHLHGKWCHHTDCDTPDDAKDERDSLKNQGERAIILKVPKSEANWYKNSPHDYVMANRKIKKTPIQGGDVIPFKPRPKAAPYGSAEDRDHFITHGMLAGHHYAEVHYANERGDKHSVAHHIQKAEEHESKFLERHGHLFNGVKHPHSIIDHIAKHTFDEDSMKKLWYKLVEPPSGGKK